MLQTANADRHRSIVGESSAIACASLFRSLCVPLLPALSAQRRSRPTPRPAPDSARVGQQAVERGGKAQEHMGTKKAGGGHDKGHAHCRGPEDRGRPLWLCAAQSAKSSSCNDDRPSISLVRSPFCSSITLLCYLLAARMIPCRWCRASVPSSRCCTAQSKSQRGLARRPAVRRPVRSVSCEIGVGSCSCALPSRPCAPLRQGRARQPRMRLQSMGPPTSQLSPRHGGLDVTFGGDACQLWVAHRMNAKATIDQRGEHCCSPIRRERLSKAVQ